MISSQPLDLKYRPRKFSDILGNKAVVQLLLQLSRAEKLGERSLMFGGTKGCGKTSLARIVACAVVCTELHDGEPCGSCESCIGVRQESIESFEEFDAATQGSVDHMRSIISELEYGNLNGKPSIFILDEAQRLTKQAQDALLKSVEDRRMLVILSTTEPHKIQGPLRSRLTEFSISPPSTQELEARLRQISNIESIKISDEALRLIIQAQNNCPRTCFVALDMLAIAGEVTIDDVKTYFRFGAIEKLVGALNTLSTVPIDAIISISELLDSEGPSWVRDNVIIVITNAIRISVGAKPTVLIPVNTTTIKGTAWLSVAKSLGVLDKPNSADIEAILLEMIPNLPTASILPHDLEKKLNTPSFPLRDSISSSLADLPIHKQEEPAKPIQVDTASFKALFTEPEKKEAPKTEPTRKIVESKKSDIEINGINFTSTEKLTSIDDRIEKGTRGIPVMSTIPNTPEVKKDKTRVPMTPKEFARGFKNLIGS